VSLVTARQLVAELSRLGLGTWSSESVRNWQREEPPCPIAEAADQGKPHRYRLIDVLGWLRAREQRQMAKGFTSQASAQLVDRIELALRQFVTGAQPVAAEAVDLFSAPLAQPTQPDLLAPVRTSNFTVVDIEQCSDVELVMKAVQDHNPQVWKQIEDALAARRRRLEAEGKLIPVEDLQATLDAQALGMRNASNAIVIALAQRIPDSSTFEHRRAIIQTAIDRMLEGLSRGEGDDAESVIG